MSAITPIQCAYSTVLAILSYLISVSGAYCALQFGIQLEHLTGRKVAEKTVYAAIAMGGGGVWAMHFIAMLGCQMGMVVRYDPTVTFVSLLVAITTTGVGLFVAGVAHVRPSRLFPGGL